MRLLATLLLALVAILPARAWGPRGHEIVAEIAARGLDPAARREVERLLGDRAAPGMRAVASWADEIRDLPEFRSTGPNHYVKFPDGRCRYRPATECADGRCVIAALNRYRDVLAAPGSDERRAEALRWVIHLVGDAHQPLHASHLPDKGGNDVQVQFHRQPMNLHRVWDSRMLEERGLRAVPYAEWLLAPGRPELEIDVTWSAEAAERWASESCALVDRIQPTGRRIDSRYLEPNLPIAERRLREAGERLAALLNATLERDRN